MRINSQKLELIMAKNEINFNELIEQSGVSRATITARKKRKSCHITTASKLAQALNVDVSEIIEEG